MYKYYLDITKYYLFLGMASKVIRKSVDLPSAAMTKLKAMAKADRRRIKNYLEQVLIDHCNINSNGVEGNTVAKKAIRHSEG
jgi:hypothetical protein